MEIQQVSKMRQNIDVELLIFPEIITYFILVEALGSEYPVSNILIWTIKICYFRREMCGNNSFSRILRFISCLMPCFGLKLNLSFAFRIAFFKASDFSILKNKSHTTKNKNQRILNRFYILLCLRILILLFHVQSYNCFPHIIICFCCNSFLSGFMFFNEIL